MTQRDAIALIDHPLLHAAPPTRWADLGDFIGAASPRSASSATFGPPDWRTSVGIGTFTLALASLLPPGSTIDAIDLRPGIGPQTTAGGVTIIPRIADFVADDLALSGLDGILMANSLHYVRDKPALLQKLRACYRGGAATGGTTTVGALLLVEYDTDRPTPHWVPYPLSFASASKHLPAAGWPHIQKLGSRPSQYFVGTARPSQGLRSLPLLGRNLRFTRLRSSSSVPFAALGNGRSELYALLALPY